MSGTDLAARVAELKRRRHAVILAHSYQSPEVQDAADYVGDSLGLSRLAAKTDAEIILFCGVHFMAETAAILSPGKTVLIPDANAGCPMANMVAPRQLGEWRAKNPDAAVVTYVNSSAAVKALSDICCTSANAVEVVASLPAGRRTLFLPDRNLGAYVASRLGRELELWDGFCPTHERMLPEMADAARARHPGAILAAHPECRPALLAKADFVASTTGIVEFCRTNPAREFIIASEIGILHPLGKNSPGKLFHPLTSVADCPNMKLNSLEKMVWALEDLAPVVAVPPDIAQKALAPITRMLEIR
ncbi:MAG: quinolinate synthase NadA [Planctomycetota bacterium]|jgi:quinolinate synthase|nr:quinolinate synthase NadA [Planctomycetota bacterium]